MATNTTNYNLIKPGVNDPTDQDLWGGQLNTNFDILDTTIKSVADITPIGSVVAYVADTAPTLWLNCDGSTVSRTTYAGLFGVIGEAYGAGDGSTTFDLPDLRGRSVVGLGQGMTGEGDLAGTDRVLGAEGGYETHLLTEPEMPSHKHTFAQVANAFGGTVPLVGLNDAGYTPPIGQTNETGEDAPHNNMHPYLVLNYIIYSGV